MKAFLIDREDIKQSMQVIINVTKEVKAGRKLSYFCRRDPEAKMETIIRNLKAEVLRLL